MKKRKRIIRIRRACIALFTAFIFAGIVLLAGAAGGLRYGMPLREGVKQIFIAGAVLGIGLGGRYALG